ncbi:MAG: DUF6430 domain-containing protein [Eubacterium sp.]|nr:DUF6430 domain-containing protein [Eubacterium sp.]
MSRLDGCCDKLKVLLKCLFSEKNSIAAAWKLSYTAIGYISSIFAFSVLLKDLAEFNKAEALCKNHWVTLVLIGIIASFIKNHEKVTYKGIVKDDDLQIEVKVNDLFSVKASSYVIPTNTYFRTIMDGDYISPESVQGAFQLKYFKKNTNELDKMIARSLKCQGIEGEDNTDIHGTVKKYPVGTVAKVDIKGKHFYFVAINDVNQYGKPVNQNYNNVDVALKGLLKAILMFGHCDDIAMPLIGTGRAAIREATLESVIEDTINRFVSSQDKIARKLTVCVRPKDYLEDKLDLERVGKYIDYKCEFK